MIPGLIVYRILISNKCLWFSRVHLNKNLSNIDWKLLHYSYKSTLRVLFSNRGQPGTNIIIYKNLVSQCSVQQFRIDFYETFCLYLAGLKIGRRQFFKIICPLGHNGGPPDFFQSGKSTRMKSSAPASMIIYKTSSGSINHNPRTITT